MTGINLDAKCNFKKSFYISTHSWLLGMSQRQDNEAHVIEADDLVPILTPTADISPRLKILAAQFTSKYNTEPKFFVRVPGRYVIFGYDINSSSKLSFNLQNQLYKINYIINYIKCYAINYIKYYIITAI